MFRKGKPGPVTKGVNSPFASKKEDKKQYTTLVPKRGGAQRPFTLNRSNQSLLSHHIP